MKLAILLSALLCSAGAHAQIPGTYPRGPFSDGPVPGMERDARPWPDEGRPGGRIERNRMSRAESDAYQRGYERGRSDEARLQRAHQQQRRRDDGDQLGNINVR